MLSTSRPRITDLQLVRCAQSGETAAFNRLVIKYRPRVVQLAMRFTGNPADAEDVAQDAFISAFRGLNHFRCESRFYTWFHRIAINTARSALKSRECKHSDSMTESPNDCDAAYNPARIWDLDTPEE